MMLFLSRLSSLLTHLYAIRAPHPTIKPTADEYEFQPAYLEIMDRPPSPLSRGIALGLTGTLSVVLLWAVEGHLDIEANAAGQIQISSHSKIIQPFETGEVSAIRVHEGQHVNAGDILVSLNAVSAKAEFNDLQGQLRFKLMEKARLEALLSQHPGEDFQPPKGASEGDIVVAKAHLLSAWKELQTSLTEKDNELHVNQANQAARNADIASLKKMESNILARLSGRRALALKHIVSKDELLEHEKERLDTEHSLSQARAQLSVLSAEGQSIQEQKDSIMAKFRHDNYDELARTDSEIDEIKQQLIKAGEHERIQDIKAPVAGVVQQLAIHTLGGVVQPAQQLMVLVPEQLPLNAEVMVLNKDIGFVHDGQPVEIKIDAFPYTRYGTLHGTVTHVSKDAVKDEKAGLIFPAQVQIPRSTIDVDGHPVSLQAGMSITADIQTGKRRIIDYLLSPLEQYQSEALRER